jgi:hypothetical protein
MQRALRKPPDIPQWGSEDCGGQRGGAEQGGREEAKRQLNRQGPSGF